MVPKIATPTEEAIDWIEARTPDAELTNSYLIAS